MREQDVIELNAVGHTPESAIIEGMQCSDYVTIGAIDDDVCCVFGLRIRDILGGNGVPWLLGTDNIVKHRRTFIPHSHQVVRDMLNICPNLENYCWVGNTVSIRWLKKLGFTFDDPEPTGVNGELFSRFHIGDSDV